MIIMTDDQPKRSRQERRTARAVNDPKRIAREQAKREAERTRQKGNGKPKTS